MNKEILEGKKGDQNRSWATIVYPDSVPEDWLSIIASLHVECFVSPLHDRDISADGSPKKPHYHVMFMFDGKKSYIQMKEMFSLFGGVGCLKLVTACGYARYLVHMDDANKAQYNVNDILSFGGADYQTVINNRADRIKALREIRAIIRKNAISSYSTLLDFLEVNRPDLEIVLANSGTIIIKEYLKSRKWSIENNCNKVVDKETGVIIHDDDSMARYDKGGE